MGIAKEIYAKVVLGTTSTTVAGVSGVPELEAFQDVVAEFQTLEEDGLIEITDLHKESQTGQRYVALVQFRKLR